MRWRFREHLVQVWVTVVPPLLDVKLWKLEELRAESLCRASKKVEYFGKYFILVAAHEDWALGHELGQDAANRPDVNPEEVVFTSKDDFRCSVPE